MGHKYHLGMPRTPLFKRVVALLGESAGGGGGIGIAPGSIEQVADATLSASDDGLQRAKVDEGLAYCVYLMAQVTRAARAPDFLSALASAGVAVPLESPAHPDLPARRTPAAAEYSVFDLVSGFTGAVDKHLRATGKRNDITELAQLAATESLTALCRAKADTLFGTSESTVQQSLRGLSTRTGFGTLTQDFFARLIRRYLEYHLSRELSNHVGRGRRFGNVNEHNQFLQQLDTHCRIATGGVREFAGDWYRKHNFEQDLTLAKTRGFTAHAVDKVRDALRFQEVRDGE